MDGLQSVETATVTFFKVLDRD